MKAITLLKDYKKYNGRVVKKGKTINVDDSTAAKMVKDGKATYATVDTNEQILKDFQEAEVKK